MTDTTIERVTTELVKQVQDYAVCDVASYEQAGEWLRICKQLQAQVQESFRPIIKKAHDTHKEAIAQEKEHLEPLKHAEDHLKRGVAGYVEVIDQENAARLAEAHARWQEEYDRECEKARAAAKKAKRKYVAPVPKLFTPPDLIEPPKVPGVSVRSDLVVSVDIGALVQAIMNGYAPVDCVKLDMPKIKTMAKNMTDEQLEVCGITVQHKRSVAVSAK